MKPARLAALVIMVLLAGCAARERVGTTDLQKLPAYSPAGEIIGMSVHDVEGQPVGELENVVADWPTGRIEYGVVSYEGNSFYVPWPAMTLSPDDRNVLRLKVDRQTVVTSPQVQTGAPIPRATSLKIHQHYGLAPLWEDRVRGRPRPPSPAIIQPSYPTGDIPFRGIRK